MSSVGSLSSSTSSSIRGYGGLASGLDRDELIKGMTIGTTTKLNQQEQKKQKIEWMQEAVRTISDKMIGFHSKYTETLTSPTNMFSSILWGRNKITTTGENSKYVSVTGTASGADAMTIMGIKQKAQNATWSSAEAAEEHALTSGTIRVNKDEYSKLYGKTIDFSYGDKNYSIGITVPEGYTDADLNNPEKVAEIINQYLADGKLGDDDNLSKHIKVTGDANGFKFEALQKDDKPIYLTGGTALELMGIKIEDEKAELAYAENEADKKIVTTDPGAFDAENLKRTMADMIKNQKLTFSYNGETAEVQLGEEQTLKDIAATIEKQLNAKFGKDRISVKVEDRKLTFKTMVPGGDGEEDTSSILKVTGGSDDALKALKLSRGLSNRENLNAAIDTSEWTVARTATDENGKKEKYYQFELSGETIEFKEGTTVQELMNKINEKTGIKVSYQEASDKFTFTSSDKGASGSIDFSENDQSTLDALSSIFRLDFAEQEEVRGKDAIVAIKYAGSDEVVQLRRDSNTFTVDGLTLSLKGKFGYDEDTGELEDVDDLTKVVEVNAEVDVDKLMSTIKSFVEDYNAIVDMVNGELTTKHDSDYDPLTSEQKDELSESEISKWEAKAKEGLLYGDSDLRSLSMDLRVVVSGGLLVQFEKVGISLSSSYSDNGKLSIDETKLRAALETDPESVEKLFTSKKGVDAQGNETFNGLATNLKSVMEKYVKTTGAMEDKGVLIRKAGSKSSALSLTQNYYFNQITSIDKLISTLQDRLKTEQDRYISQFSTLETLIANMNSQSSYLSSMGG